MNITRSRRWFLNLVTLTALGGFSVACGVKGPLYLPDEAETEKKKDKDEEKTSHRNSVRTFPTLG